MTRRHWAMAPAAVAVMAAPLLAQSATATQTVSLQIQPMSAISVAPGTPTLRINTVPAGSQNATPAIAVSSYAITSNQDNRKITATLSADMPAGMTLYAYLAGPPGALTPIDPQILSATPTDMVVSIGRCNTSGLAITYTLVVPAVTAPVSGSRVVTFTITAG